MDIVALNSFLSKENIKRHLDHLNTMILKYSILEKSVTSICGKRMSEISKIRLPKDVREEALWLLWYINSHRVYFNSFVLTPTKSDLLLKNFSSREDFLYSLFEFAKEKEGGFLYVYKDKEEKVRYDICDSYGVAFLKWTPILAIDLYEHSYFSDYFFNKEKYLHAALSHLNTGKLI
jgi:superoxide dismutase